MIAPLWTQTQAVLARSNSYVAALAAVSPEQNAETDGAPTDLPPIVTPVAALMQTAIDPTSQL